MNWLRFRLTKLRKAPLKDRFLLFYTGAIRRPFYNLFRKEYIKKQLAERKGECKQCGKCCEIMDVIGLKCKYFKEGKCIIFKYAMKKKLCDTYVYPFDEKDKRVTKNYTKCGFYWK